MARAGAVFIDVLPSMAGWNTAVRTQAAVSLEGAGMNAGKGFTAGLMRSIKRGNIAGAINPQMKALAEQSAAASSAASAKVAAARKREADATGAVRVAEAKLEEVRANQSAKASQVAAAEERLAKAQRVQAGAVGQLTAATSALSGALLREEEIQAKVSSSSVVASGRFSRMRSSVAGGADKMTSKLGSFAKAAGGMAGLFGAFEVAKFAGESLHAAMDYQKGTQVLQTAAGESAKNIGMVRSGLMDISSETGTSLAQMTEGMYTVEKAGIRGGKGLDVMRAAAKGAKDEGADLGIVTNALTTVMTTSNGKITAPAKAMNAVMVAAGHSKTTLQEFAGSLSSVLPLASKVGIGFDQVSGAISTMTSQGMSAQQSTQDLNHVIASLATPTKVMSTEMHLFGINSADVRDKLGKRGLQGTIEFLSEAVKSKLGKSAKGAIEELKKLPKAAQDIATKYQQGLLTTSQFEKAAGKQKLPVEKALLHAGPAMRGYTQALSKMTGGQMGLTTSLMLTGKNAETFKKSTEDVGKAMNSTADFDEKWGITSKSTANQLAIAKQSISNVGTALATQLLPFIAKAASAFASAVMHVAKFTKQNWSWLGPVAKGLGIIAGVLVTFSVIERIVKWVKAWTIVQAALNTETGFFTALWSANPLGIVILAVAALAIGLIYAYKHSETFRKMVQAAFRGVAIAVGAMKDAAQAAFAFVVKSFLGLVGTIIDGAAHAFGWVPGIGKNLKDAASAFDSFRDQVNASLDGIHKSVNIRFNVQENISTNSGGAGKAAYHAPGNARGTNYWRGGDTRIAEDGPELIALPRGSRVTPAMETGRILSGHDGSRSSSTRPSTVVVRIGERHFVGYVEDIADDRIFANAGLSTMQERAR